MATEAHVIPGSDDAAHAGIRAAMAEFEREVAAADLEIAEAKEHLHHEQTERVDDEMVASLRKAARNPDAPDSLRRLARRVQDGRLDWTDVVHGRSNDPDVAEFRSEATATARAHFAEPDERADVPPGQPPVTGSR